MASSFHAPADCSGIEPTANAEGFHVPIEHRFGPAVDIASTPSRCPTSEKLDRKIEALPRVDSLFANERTESDSAELLSVGLGRRRQTPPDHPPDSSVTKITTTMPPVISLWSQKFGRHHAVRRPCRRMK